MKGVFVYRNIADLNKILDYSQQPNVKGGKAVVVGGGLLGLEAAKAVYDLEEIKDVVIVNRQAFPLSRQLDDHGGEIVLRRIEAMGVEVLTKSSPKGIIAAKGQFNTFAGLTMNDESILEADMVIFAVGISPRDDLAKKAGLICEPRGGVTVNDLLETSSKDVYAIGECASWNHNTYGLIAPGVEMADILSFNFTQTKTDVGGFKPRQMVSASVYTSDTFAERIRPEQSRPLDEAQTHGRRRKLLYVVRERVRLKTLSRSPLSVTSSPRNATWSANAPKPRPPSACRRAHPLTLFRSRTTSAA
jgi:nitrite reductase (NAD(P)H)